MRNKTYNPISRLKKLLEPAYPSPVQREQIAWWLVEAATSCSQAQFMLNPIISDEAVSKIEHWIHEHLTKNKPLQYILGSVPFCDLEIAVEPPVLIPRPETEEWCMELLSRLAPLQDQPLRILDLCTGSGCIALALAQALPKAKVLGVDISKKAIALAKRNAQLNKIGNVEWRQTDLKKPWKLSDFDLIVSNPPYITDSAYTDLDPSVKKWEDQEALASGSDGLELIRHIVEKAPEALRHHPKLSELGIPQLIVEIGYDQGQSVAELMKMAGYSLVTINNDLSGKNRTVSANPHNP